MKDERGTRPVHEASRYRDDPHCRDLVLFYEYFDGNDGRGVGACHQTGWTGLVTKLLQQSEESEAPALPAEMEEVLSEVPA